MKKGVSPTGGKIKKSKGPRMSLRLQVRGGVPGLSCKYTSPSTDAVPYEDHRSLGNTMEEETWMELSIVE